MKPLYREGPDMGKIVHKTLRNLEKTVNKGITFKGWL